MSDEYKIGESGHYSYDNQKNPIGLSTLNQDLTYKLRLKVLQGKFDPDHKDGPMIRKFKESGLSPEEFLATWKS